MSKLLRQSLPALVIVGSCFSASVAHGAETLSLQQGMDLVKSSACLGCHAIDKKRLGPGFKQIAQRYSGQPDAETQLVAAIRNGGANKWGAVPMPAQRHVSVESAALISNWILSLDTK